MIRTALLCCWSIGGRDASYLLGHLEAGVAAVIYLLTYLFTAATPASKCPSKYDASRPPILQQHSNAVRIIPALRPSLQPHSRSNLHCFQWTTVKKDAPHLGNEGSKRKQPCRSSRHCTKVSREMAQRGHVTYKTSRYGDFQLKRHHFPRWPPKSRFLGEKVRVRAYTARAQPEVNAT